MIDRARRAGTPPAEGGFTFLEGILALAILSLLLASLGASLAGNSVAVQASRDDAAAGRAAASRLEVLRSGREALLPGRRAFVPDPGAAVILPGLRGEEVVREAGPGLVAVEVRVQWKGAGGQERTAVLSTLFAREGAR